jgi:hypothetical protein
MWEPATVGTASASGLLAVFWQPMIEPATDQPCLGPTRMRSNVTLF